ncbi:hypothetical protein LX36DRAFT_593539 [Colletotrichum falcatum]|nr:hypothetical protein LX36DRAFT_593539 [Colletotrichum falcatum]
MRTALILAAAVGLTAATPLVPRDDTPVNNMPLDIFDDATIPTKVGPDVAATSETPTYDPAQAKAAAAQDATANPVSPANSGLKARSSTCTGSKLEPDGYGPVPSPDTYDAFMSSSNLSDIASAAPVPQGYSLAFQGVQASVSSPSYMGLYTLKSFDSIRCQQYCDAASACFAFNLYMERDPKYTPGDTCVDPPSITNYKCTLWGAQISQDAATNKGQWRNKFHVGITGSNGYNKLAPPPAYAGFENPIAFGGAIQAPNSYMGSKFYAGPFNPGQCAAACQATTKYDHDHPRADGTYDACNFFNAYVLSKDNVPQGTYCSMYTKSWAKSYSTNYGQWRGSSYYSVSQSYGYTLMVQDPGHI